MNNSLTKETATQRKSKSNKDRIQPIIKKAIVSDSEIRDAVITSFEYKKNRNGLSIIGCTGIDNRSVSKLTIPEEIDGTPVTKIGSRAFESWYWSKGFKIPDSVKEIGSNAFKNWTGNVAY